MASGSTSAATISGKLRGLFTRAREPHGRRDRKPAVPGRPADWKLRAAHAGVAFLVVLSAYWVYAAAIVRLIEPTFAHRDTDKLSAGEAEGARQRISRELAEIEPFFGPGSWELQNPKILESDSLKLLMGGYRNLGDGRVRIHPCTMIFLPRGNDPNPQRRADSAVILQAPEGALLRFDQPLNLRRMKIGRLVAGTLEGQIVIRSAGREPGSEDDLWITTRDVQLTERSIWTAEPVFFRWGPHYGRGREFRISLIPGTAIPKAMGPVSRAWNPSSWPAWNACTWNWGARRARAVRHKHRPARSLARPRPHSPQPTLARQPMLEAST